MLAITACSSVGLLNSSVSRTGLIAENDIAYGTAKEMKLDLYKLKDAAPGMPVVVFFHGSSWQAGNKSEYVFVAEPLARAGFLVAVPNYSLYPPATYPQFLDDGAEAVSWMKKHAKEHGGDPNNIILIGHSAGAYIATMLALDESYMKNAEGNARWIKGVVGLAGLYDFLPLKDEKLKAIFGPEKGLKMTQPVNHVGRNEPPMLLLHGDQDLDVKPSNTIHLADKLVEKGNRVESVIYPGLDHKGIVLEFASPLVHKTDVLEQVIQFVKRR